MSTPPYGIPPSRPEDYQAMRLDLVRNRWDQKAARWDADLADADCHLHEDGAYQRFVEVAEDIVGQRGGFCRQQLLVDLGCGTGLVLAHFLNRFAAGLGIDLSPRMIEIAQRRQLPNSHFVTGNGFELSTIVGRAGAVLSRGILVSHYGKQWAAVLFAQIRQVLTPGGFALLDFLNEAARQRYPSNPANKTYYLRDEIHELASTTGLRAAILGDDERRVLLVHLEADGRR
jgi:SAM-dependent methyltransferase